MERQEIPPFTGCWCRTMLLLLLLLLLLLGMVVGGREEGRGSVVAFLNECVVFQHARREQEDGASVDVCHQVRRGGGEGGRVGGAGGELQEGFEDLASEPYIRPDSFVEQRNGLGRNMRGDGAPGVSRAEVGRDEGRGLRKGGAAAAAGRRGGRRVAGGGEGHEGDDIQKHEEAQRRQGRKEWWSCHACA